MLRRVAAITLAALMLVAANRASAQDPPTEKPAEPPFRVKVEVKVEPVPPQPPPDGLPAPKPPVDLERLTREGIKPLPPVAIPDDPPPHEGALFDLPYIIEPPDIIVVELLEALPSRPITGERLVRSDGKVSLGFYGDVYVRGLTASQAKEKIVLHMREYLNDDVLGLIGTTSVGGNTAPPGPDSYDGPPLSGPGRNPFDLEPPAGQVPAVPATRPARSPFVIPDEGPVAPPAEKKPEEGKIKPPGVATSRRGRPDRPRSHRARIRRTAQVQVVPPAQDRPPVEPPDAPEGFRPVQVPDGPGMRGEGLIMIEPVNSSRVYVEVTAFNSKVYNVLGDVGTPGRLPTTGKETVLDALNYAGGLLASADPHDIHLYRPARGGKPAKDYKIDHAAILKGIAEANLQVFPGDRLVVGRNAIVKKAAELDRAAAALNGVFNSIIQYGSAARSLTSLNVPYSTGVTGTANGAAIPLMTPAERDAMVKEWAEFLWSISDGEKGAMLDEKAFKEALMKKLTPKPEPKKE